MNMEISKIIRIITLNLLAVAACLTLNSCLKETTYPPLYSWSVPSVISFQDNGGADASGAGYGTTTTPYPLYNFNLAANGTGSANFSAIVIYGPNGGAPNDITVNLAFDQAGLDAFNTANSTGFVAPDPSTYSFPASVVIKKGETQAYARVYVTPNTTPDPNTSYAIPLMITSASSGTVSTNFGHEINALSVSP